MEWAMSIGKSGRIVIEIDADIKRRLYAALISDGLTLRQWFLDEAREYLLHAVSTNEEGKVSDQETEVGK
jgi:hypothetical protein